VAIDLAIGTVESFDLALRDVLPLCHACASPVPAGPV
jgi:hypothetical protein